MPETSEQPVPDTSFRVLTFIVAYNHAAFIASVLERIPQIYWDEARGNGVLVIDDASADDTASLCRAWAKEHNRAPVVLRNPVNQGYGGNQKLGYAYAIRHGYDAVVLLHGDGQYDPALLPQLLAPIAADEADVVLGSRMMRRRDALKGGMPLYKFFGNIALTRLQNALLGTSLAEFHTGLRAYRVSMLSRIPFAANADYFDFDTDILLQLHHQQARIAEVRIPTHYGYETSYVNSLYYGLRILRSTIAYRMYRAGIYYHRRFDDGTPHCYANKTAFPSSQRFSLEHVPPGARVLDIGGGTGQVAALLRERGCVVVGVDRMRLQKTQAAGYDRYLEANLNDRGLLPSLAMLHREYSFSHVLLLDVLEHLPAPELLLRCLRDIFAGTGAVFFIALPNVAFLPQRLGLLLGRFNYTPAGILDRTHLRLFTRASARDFLRQQGFDLLSREGIPPPLPLVLPKLLQRSCMALARLLARVFPGLFAYQNTFIAVPRPTLEVLLARAES